MVRIKVVEEQSNEILLKPVQLESMKITCSEKKADINARLLVKDISPDVTKVASLEGFVSAHNNSIDAHNELIQELKTKNYTQDVTIAKKVNIVDLAEVAKTGSYNDLLDKPSSFDVGDAKITILQGNEEKGSFTVNQSDNVEIYIDDYSNDLINKVDKDLSNCTKPYITESYVNGTSGYNVYSNGYCEQWGLSSGAGAKTVTFLKPFVNTDYTVNSTLFTSGTVTTYTIVIYSKTANSVKLYNPYNAEIGKFWEAKGYIS